MSKLLVIMYLTVAVISTITATPTLVATVVARILVACLLIPCGTDATLLVKAMVASPAAIQAPTETANVVTASGGQVT